MNSLENKNIFLDLSRYVNVDGCTGEYLSPFTVYHLEELKDIYPSEGDFYQPIFYKDDDIILAHGKNGGMFFYTCKVYLLKDLKRFGETICLHEGDYITHLLFIIMTNMAGGNICCHPFLKNKGMFIGKMIYYLDLPFDNFTLKNMKVNPDLSATTLQSFCL